jgi:hypothetical protein
MNHPLPGLTGPANNNPFAVSCPNLYKYVQRRNAWEAIFDEKAKRIDLRMLTTKQRTTLLNSIECDLSPENLCCDGEASPQYVRERSKFLNAARAELALV